MVDRQITLTVDDVTAERLEWLAKHLEQDPATLAQAIFNFEIEAQFCLVRGPWLRKYMYRGSEPYFSESAPQHPESDQHSETH